MNLFDLVAKLTLDSSQYEDGIKKAKSKISKLGSAVGGAVQTVGKISAAAVGASATAIGAIVKQSVDAYGNYEQLAGGIETLFGESADIIKNYAHNAFSNAQMSTNDYMDTVISFSGALIKSAKDTETAAELSNMAVQDMADQANKYGKSVSDVSQTYSSLSRGIYTTLDNLFGGMFAGTKKGLQEMLDTAEKYRASLGETVSYSADSYADIVSAIHDISVMTGVAGTSVNEAGKTIQGSLNMTKAAWENLVAGIADPDADIGVLVDNLISSAGTAVGNLLPTIQRALTGIGSAIEKLAPEIGKTLSGLISDVLPELLKSAVGLLKGVGKALIDNADDILDAVFEIVDFIVDTLNDPAEMANIISAAGEIILKLADGLTQALPELLPAVFEIIENLFIALTSPENLNKMIPAALELLLALADGFIESIGVIIDKAPEIIENLFGALVDNAPKMLDAAGELLQKLADGFTEHIDTALDKIPELIDSLKAKFEEGWGAIKEAGKHLIDGLWAGIKEKYEWVKEKVSGVVSSIKNIFTGKKGFDEASPSKWARRVFGYVMEGGVEGMERETPNLIRTAGKTVSAVQDMFDNTVDYTPAISARYDGTMASMTVSDKRIDRIMTLLETYLPQVANQTFELDGDIVAQSVDNRLGRTAAMKARV